MDTTCTALCNAPDEAICTSTTYSGNSETECAPYGDKYCCMVVTDVYGNGTVSSIGTCNKEKDVSTDQDDGYTVECQAVTGFVSSLALLALSFFH
mmetsp:Transcript_48831/g.35935  ORF Transcript_48831/g.35935 Transcript_48831/m.35935 type:complete len:95 (+) Transcript_48831:580-864(+)|eukprot:CAMPEP_0202977280 /NCGR_PEP_ID=MMETSP1396-20130829/84161_1 /ASSEMBLY_ACC=CAM_ASM_000872 /TAXON_ID= /ORGANISM="Pseudokeronopsis sp., Strain Brazil" /LENGTH=94 /DNA_ID=CAMNT_0049716007 /DNA_START=993 /DNA_END=1277 /DNA_ORIENTATION=-